MDIGNDWKLPKFPNIRHEFQNSQCGMIFPIFRKNSESCHTGEVLPPCPRAVIVREV